jgi:hypothetical protein
MEMDLDLGCKSKTKACAPGAPGVPFVPFEGLALFL